MDLKCNAVKATVFVTAVILAIVLLIIIVIQVYKPTVPYELKGDESPVFTFLVKHLLDESGGVYTNLRDDQDFKPDIANNHQMLSESTSLLMEYAVRSNNEELFKTQYRFLLDYLLTEEGFIRWVHDPAGRREDVHTNATIDDLKIIHALLKAAQLWQEPKYERTALRIANTLKEQVLQDDGFLPDYYDWQLQKAAVTVTSSYLDLSALGKLAEYDAAWENAYLRAKQLLHEAKLANGLFKKTYQIEWQAWMEQTDFNMIDVLYAALHLTEAGHHADATCSFVVQKWKRDRKLYAAYDRDGTAMSETVSPAVYALAHRLLVHCGFQEIAEQIYNELMQLSIQDEESAYYGGFVELSTLEAYSFDHLQALLSQLE
jgi:hypothetical protein